ncbi:TPA: hypothetical protein OT963_002966 [Enterococcus faecalis]|uniref:hypothetical protein n=1 Tax=Enterococcus faecalis TaxID=1351 RepID=UPI001CF44FC2|nr:hypothetical protein [Enterococcus faecalis]MCA6777745.1 hypothetical protein [Enterococcus faecalis]HCT6950291.1 hypothetical protein [Enterococcus faecalis]HCT6953164.1 hypothetical protein [Enterococcus faecalis]HCT6961313.1 hypothetical protein [Enterococcus faecalis]HCT8022685.1 hypothetical protein [Enterococcus faecalis]
MKVVFDTIGRIVLRDDYSPYGAIIFEKDCKNNRVAIYQDSENEHIRSIFENLDESVEFEKNELIKGLQKVISLLKEGE